MKLIGVELSASYAYASYQSDALRYSRLDLDEDGVSAGGTIYLRLESTPTLEVFPRVGIAYVNISQELENTAGQSTTYSVEDIGYMAGFDFLFNRKVTLGPEFSSVDGHNSYRFKIGLVVANRRR